MLTRMLCLGLAFFFLGALGCVSKPIPRAVPREMPSKSESRSPSPNVSPSKPAEVKSEEPRTAYVLSSKANVREVPGGAKKVASFAIGTKVRIEKLEDAWAYVATGDVKGWIHGSLLGPSLPSIERMMAGYHATKSCVKSTDEAEQCDLVKLKEQRKWVERASALAPRNPEVVRLLVLTLKRLLEGKYESDLISPKYRKATKKQLQIARQGLEALTPIYFLPESFNDSGPYKAMEFSTSWLSCRQQLTRIYTKKASGQDWSRKVLSKNLWPKLRKYCAEFGSKRTLWSFVADSEKKKASWRKLPIDVDMSLLTNMNMNCDEGLLPTSKAELTFKFRRQDGGVLPALFMGSAVNPLDKPVEYYSMEMVKPKPLADKNSARVSAQKGLQPKRGILFGEHKAWGIKGVYLETLVDKISGPSEEVAELKVVLVWASGQREILYEERGVAKDEFYYPPPNPVQLIISDFEGDGSPDLLLKVSEGGILFQTRAQKIFRKKDIVFLREWYGTGC